MSRHSDFTQELADEICKRLADGETLTEICQDEHMPDRSTVCNWLRTQENSAFSAQYARARESQGDGVFDDVKRVQKRVESGELAPDAGRVVINALTWRAKVLKPKVYGDGVNVKVSDPDGGPVAHKVTIEVVDSPRSLAAPVAQLAIEGQVTPEED